MCDVDARWNLADNDAGLYDSCRPINSEGRSSLVIIMKFLPYWLRENIALIMYIDRWRKCEEIMAWCMVYFECDDGRWFISQRRISRDMYMVGRYGGRRSQMREHQKLCKLAYALRTVTHIPDPWDLNLYYGISVHIILTEFALFRSCTAGWPTSLFVCKKQVQNPKKIEENKFPFLTSNLLLRISNLLSETPPLHLREGNPAINKVQLLLFL